MTNVLTMRSPRWLGWVLLIAGGLDAVLWGFLIVVFALFADEPWGDVAGTLIGFFILGVLAAVAGIRILRGTSSREAAASS
jgi:F0F1-type ATP synthase assembly protein I